jgi:hypothetical protein
MKKITSLEEIKIGDKILLDSEEEGIILKKEPASLYGKVFSYQEEIRTINPSEIISLNRKGEFYMVEI